MSFNAVITCPLVSLKESLCHVWYIAMGTGDYFSLAWKLILILEISESSALKIVIIIFILHYIKDNCVITVYHIQKWF